MDCPLPGSSTIYFEPKNLQAGDVLFCYSPEIAEEEQSMPTNYCHVAIALGSGKILDAQGGSVRVTTFEILLDDYNHIAVKRTPEPWTAAMQEAIQDFAQNNIGKNFNCIGEQT